MHALIFDFDGLILDTELPDYISWQEVYHSYGVELPLEKWITIVGGTAESDFEPHEYLEELIGTKVDREQIWVSRRKSYLEHLESQPILPGVLTYLEEAKKQGLKLAVASSSPENWVIGHLSRLDLKDYFDVICTADDVEQTKPNPALLLLTAEKVGVQPEEVIVLEDSYNGVLAARRAGMFVVAVPNQVTGQADLSQANLILASLEEMPLKDLMTHMENHK